MRENDIMISKLKMLQVDKELVEILETLDKYKYSLKNVTKHLNEPWKLLKILMDTEYSRIKSGLLHKSELGKTLSRLIHPDYKDRYIDIIDLIQLGVYVPDIYKTLYNTITKHEDEWTSIRTFVELNSSLSVIVDKYRTIKLGSNISLNRDGDYITIKDSITNMSHRALKTDFLEKWTDVGGKRRLIFKCYNNSTLLKFKVEPNNGDYTWES